MTDREKLIELIRNTHKKCKAKKTCHECEQYGNGSDCVYRFIADELLAHGVAVQEWIPVTERLPEVGKTVMVCGNRGGIYTAYLERDGRYPLWHKLNSKSHYCNPTHWMPLPEPPKEE